MGVESVNSSALYFSASQAVSTRQSKETDKKKKTSSAGKSIFHSNLEKQQAEFQLTQEGLPLEILEMSMDEAIVFLKDQVDIAGDALQQNPGLSQIDDYRKKLSSLMKYISRNNYEILKIDRKYRGRPLIDKKTGKQSYYIQVNVINKKLEQLTYDIIYNHSKNINLLARIEEINGLIVDLLAS